MIGERGGWEIEVKKDMRLERKRASFLRVELDQSDFECLSECFVRCRHG